MLSERVRQPKHLPFSSKRLYKMRVLHVNLSDLSGGAAIAAWRLHQGLLNLDVDSQVLAYRIIQKDDPRVHPLVSGNRRQIYRIQLKLERWLSRFQQDPMAFHCSPNFWTSPLVDRINALNPDLVHLHWVAAGILPLNALRKIKQPIVWTHHDMWPFCGAEHYSYDERWRLGYSKESRSSEACGMDINRWAWERKRKAWRDVPITHIGPSRWMSECAQQSKLWKGVAGNQFTVIPNGLDIQVFKPYPKEKARSELGLQQDTKVLLFGAHSVSSSIKGGDLLYSALQELEGELSGRCILVTFGGGAFNVPAGYQHRHMGILSELKQITKLYNAADVMLVPSRLEAFGQTASESLACGTPVVCFETSGLRDIVIHQNSGYMAKPYDHHSFADGIRWCLAELDQGARGSIFEAAHARFDINLVANRYRRLYAKLTKDL